MILLGNPSYSDLICVFVLFLGLALRFWVAQRRFNRKNEVGSRQFKSYFHAMLIPFAEHVLMALSITLIFGLVLWFLFS